MRVIDIDDFGDVVALEEDEKRPNVYLCIELHCPIKTPDASLTDVDGYMQKPSCNDKCAWFNAKPIKGHGIRGAFCGDKLIGVFQKEVKA
jgi:hypothetical protein